MAIFSDYARYYNLLYRDKDYAGEVAFVLDVLRRHGCDPKQILDLGCGTGRHDLEFAKLGIQVTGVDMSETMLAIGRESLAQKVPNGAARPVLNLGDARTVRLGQKFDAVISLFHVMSYQNTEADALAVMETAKAHLKPGGLFLFDFWYGPGVLTDPPKRRERIIEDERTRIRRIAEPVHRVEDNIVVVNYNVEITDIASGKISLIEESHSMRYWFFPELRYLADLSGFSFIADGKWMAEDKVEIDTWNAWMLCNKVL
jgi:SAM-dependent methyltransferase